MWGVLGMMLAMAAAMVDDEGVLVGPVGNVGDDVIDVGICLG